MKRKKNKLNLSRRNFLAGTATLAGIAATASVAPISIANANHSEGKKGLPEFINWKDRDVKNQGDMEVMTMMSEHMHAC